MAGGDGGGVVFWQDEGMTDASTHDRSATIDKLRDVWNSITDLVGTLNAADWERPTDCPGWSVRDQLAHLITIERTLAGHPSPEHHATPLPDWVHNDLGRTNEHAVDHWRGRPIDELVAAWRAVASERLAQLVAASDAELAADSWTPLGPGTVLDLLQSRILDHWMHEQDIRRAVGRPGHEDGPAAEHTVDLLLAGLPMVVGKRAATPEGASVVVWLTGPVHRDVAVTVRDGRAVRTAHPATPTATLTLSSATFAELAGGRVSPELPLDDGRIESTGATELARAVVTNLNILP